MAQSISTPVAKSNPIAISFPVVNVLNKLINHPYAFRPQVWILLASGEEIEADVMHVNTSQVYVVFGSLFTGTIFVGA